MSFTNENAATEDTQNESLAADLDSIPENDAHRRYVRTEISGPPWILVWEDTVWKFYGFSITQILREINVGNSKSTKSAILTHLEVQNFDFHEFLHFLKAEIYQLSQIKSPKIGKNGNFRTFAFSIIDFT